MVKKAIRRFPLRPFRRRCTSSPFRSGLCAARSSRTMRGVKLSLRCNPSGCPSAIAPPLGFTAGIEARLLNHRQRLRRECLVELNHRRCRSAKASQLQRLWNREYRTDAELFRRTSGRRISHESRERLEHPAPSRAHRSSDHRRGAIAHRRTVACRHRSLHVKRGLQLRQYLQRGIRSRKFIRFELKSLRRRFRARLRSILRLHCRWPPT